MHQFEIFIPVLPELSDLMRGNRMANECLHESHSLACLSLFLFPFSSQTEQCDCERRHLHSNGQEPHLTSLECT